MNGFLENVKRQLSTFMRGRYGADGLSLMLMGVGIVMTFTGMLTGFDILSYLALIVLAYVIFRSYSKNIGQRRKELAAYNKVVAKPRAWFSLTRKKWANRKTTRYFICKNCGASLSVPVGKGTIKTTCPKCKTQTTRKS